MTTRWLLRGAHPQQEGEGRAVCFPLPIPPRPDFLVHFASRTRLGPRLTWLRQEEALLRHPFPACLKALGKRKATGTPGVCQHPSQENPCNLFRWDSQSLQQFCLGAVPSAVAAAMAVEGHAGPARAPRHTGTKGDRGLTEVVCEQQRACLKPPRTGSDSSVHASPGYCSEFSSGALLT